MRHHTPTTRRVGALAAAAALAAGVATTTTGAAQASPAPTASTPSAVAAQAIPRVADGHGITVTAPPEKLSERSYRFFVTSDAVTTNRTHAGDGRFAVIVTLPERYDASATRYPTLYFLHGQDDGGLHFFRSMDIERIVGSSKAIVVTPDGAYNSWYTDWVGNPKERWETFHTQQLVPWIDQNFRTQASKEHRAIAGFSMGGYGALHYAFKHPDLFNHVSSYSGGADMEDQLVRGAVLATAGYGPFGSPFWPADTVWKSENPVRNAARLRGMGITLSAGDGGLVPGAGYVIERGAGNSQFTLSKTLAAQGIPHVFDMYGHGVSYNGYTCDGSHTGVDFGCPKYQFSKDIGRIMASID